MYDPDRRPSFEDMGSYCPACEKSLMVVNVALRAPEPGRPAELPPHPSGSGLLYPCPFCGVMLHENPRCYVFCDEPNFKHRTFSAVEGQVHVQAS